MQAHVASSLGAYSVILTNITSGEAKACIVTHDPVLTVTVPSRRYHAGRRYSLGWNHPAAQDGISDTNKEYFAIESVSVTLVVDPSEMKMETSTMLVLHEHSLVQLGGHMRHHLEDVVSHRHSDALLVLIS